MSKVNVFFSTIENYNFESKTLKVYFGRLIFALEVNLQQVTRLHVVMRDISLLPIDIIPGNDEYHFLTRASALVQKWPLTLLQDVKSRKWVVDKTWTMLQDIDWHDGGTHSQ